MASGIFIHHAIYGEQWLVGWLAGYGASAAVNCSLLPSSSTSGQSMCLCIHCRWNFIRKNIKILMGSLSWRAITYVQIVVCSWPVLFSKLIITIRIITIILLLLFVRVFFFSSFYILPADIFIIFLNLFYFLK